MTVRAFIIIIFLVACSTPAQRDARRDAWIGKPVTELVDELGPPDGQVEVVSVNR